MSLIAVLIEGSMTFISSGTLITWMMSELIDELHFADAISKKPNALPRLTMKIMNIVISNVRNIDKIPSHNHANTADTKNRAAD